MPNDVSFFAINADDVPRARKFYDAVFGWSFEPWSPLNFYLIETGKERTTVAYFFDTEGNVAGIIQQERNA